jgi:hypothetical protein
MATSPRNLTTHEYPQGVNEIAQNDLNKEVSKSTSNTTHGMVSKNAMVRWFLTNDEPWTKKIKARQLNAKASTLVVVYQNGLDSLIELTALNGGQFSIDDTRRVIEGLIDRDGNTESECGVCNHELKDHNSECVACSRCTFQTCGCCQRKMMAKHGYVECPGCRSMLLGASWYKKFFEQVAVEEGERLKANKHWVRYYEEVIALSRWNYGEQHKLPQIYKIKPDPDRFLPNNAEEAVSLMRYLLDDIR